VLTQRDEHAHLRAVFTQYALQPYHTENPHAPAPLPHAPHAHDAARGAANVKTLVLGGRQLHTHIFGARVASTASRSSRSSHSACETETAKVSMAGSAQHAQLLSRGASRQHAQLLSLSRWVACLEALECVLPRGEAVLRDESTRNKQKTGGEGDAGGQADDSDGVRECQRVTEAAVTEPLCLLTLVEAQAVFREAAGGDEHVNFGTFRDMVLRVRRQLRQRVELARRVMDARRSLA
jgi:hypothetical protein